MQRQKSEQFRKLRNIWKATKELEHDELLYNPSNYQSVRDLGIRRNSNELKIQQKWNGPVSIKPTISLFNIENPEVGKQFPLPQYSIEDQHIKEAKNFEKLKKNEQSEERPLQIGYKVKHTEKMRKRNYNFLEIKLISNWGDSSYIGLSEIEIYNENSEKIKISGNSVTVKHSSHPMDPLNLFNGMKHSTDEKDMWLSPIAISSKRINICIKIGAEHNICGIRIWNYNKHGIESNRGVKEAEIIFNREKVWRGELKIGGSMDNFTEIALLVGFKFMDLDSKIIKAVSSMVRIVNAPPGNPKSSTSNFRKYTRSDIKLKSSISQTSSIQSLHSPEVLAESAPLRIEDLILKSIPEQPKGRFLKIVLLNTWGDQNYIGLCGIEFWDESGLPIAFPYPKLQISGNPLGLNSLPEYKNGISAIDKLVDGVYRTCDDYHAWLAPYNSGEKHFILIDFLKSISLSMIRIWNFNKSRIHSYRGVKGIEIFFDEKIFIFKGDIKKAPGTIKNAEQYCEYIVLTKSTETLEKIAENDWVDKHQEDEIIEFPEFLRPDTTSKKFDTTPPGE